MAAQSDPPAPDEIEVSVFGPGRGEAIVVHLGSGRWMIIDSCVDPKSGEPAAKTYLDRLGVPLDESVSLVVATHWHNDHIRGLSTLFAHCPRAKFALASSLLRDEFRQLVASYGIRNLGTDNGISEMASVLDQLRERQRQGSVDCRYAISDRCLLREPGPNGTQTNVYALSPSDASVTEALLGFGSLIPQEGAQPRALASPKRNPASVVIWVEVGETFLLFGADLEVAADANKGWGPILDQSQVIQGRARVFKIPHHGSENAHHDRVWNELLHSNPEAAITPFRGGRKALPSQEDVARIAAQTSRAFQTAPTGVRQTHWTNRVVHDFVRTTTRHMYEANSGWGQIRLRLPINTDQIPPKVDLFGDAFPIN